MYSAILVLISLSGILGSQTVSHKKSVSSPWYKYLAFNVKRNSGVFKPAYGFGKRSGKGFLRLHFHLMTFRFESWIIQKKKDQLQTNWNFSYAYGKEWLLKRFKIKIFRLNYSFSSIIFNKSYTWKILKCSQNVYVQLHREMLVFNVK